MLRHGQRGRFFVLGAIVATAALSGCDTLDRMEVENYQRECDKLGIARGTPSYDNCMLQQQKLQEEEVEHAMDRDAMRHHK
ncbi:hypothetical protein [Bordetella petrii]|uniref:hypothetical protein n=1 Tax=Bordetella petrii TaxID=94624 RepID=UPI0038B33E5C